MPGRGVPDAGAWSYEGGGGWGSGAVGEHLTDGLAIDSVAIGLRRHRGALSVANMAVNGPGIARIGDPGAEDHLRRGPRLA